VGILPANDQTPWVQVLAILKPKMSRAEFDTWVAPTELLSLSGDVLTVGGANSVGIARLENGHRAEVEAAVREVIGRPLRVRFVVMA
jgi:chromosomal replication initiation ATPase DnaA